MAIYNNHTLEKVVGWFLIFLAVIFIFVLFGYQLGGELFLSFGSSLETSGPGGVVVAELIIYLLVFIGALIIAYYFTLTNVSSKLLLSGDIKAVDIINPGKKTAAHIDAINVLEEEQKQEAIKKYGLVEPKPQNAIPIAQTNYSLQQQSSAPLYK